MKIKAILTTLVESPEYYWEDNPRQMEKLRKRVDKAIEKLGLTPGELVDEVIFLSELRLKAKAKTIFLSNIGSSGSHLFQACIARAWPSIPLGEIYLPKKLIQDVEPLSKDEKNLVCEAYLLLHDYTYSERYNTTAFLINTLHHPKLSNFRRWSANYRSALILRNPVDIVVSRTFRKNDYKSYLGKDGCSDKEYLAVNVEKVDSFLRSASDFNYNVTIKFEDLVKIKDGVIDSLQELTGSPIPKEALRQSVVSAIGDGNATNKFSGEIKKVPDELIFEIRSHLDWCCVKYGYVE
ncbi:hypothetical protein [Halomonas lysinitropha]|uniref:Sulfotransferase family protein n=1 Tax=Halomonas lysinitropha TaxID=2607506 RepID=A0A5K1I268_9GAMM|nr:hypothetical protein [Halomonas lysinitropha]VVZ95525.1 hypothetical protein HALO32_01596 [Halomonas lysinitropha]